MKVFTLLGTRPEIIRLSEIIKKLDLYIGKENHFIFNTMQNYNDNLNANFFNEFKLRNWNNSCVGNNAYPDENYNTFTSQVARIFPALERHLQDFKPDRFLCLGDTNSTLGVIVAKRLGIPVYHMEAGNRCYNYASPEEVNRHVIDSITDIHMPYSAQSKQNLLAEGISNHKIFVTGNPIYEVLNKNTHAIDKSDILKKLDLSPREYILVTLHRQENVDNISLIDFLNVFKELSYSNPIIFSCHPRTRKNITPDFMNTINDKNFKILNPLGFFDFVKLEKNALCVMSDSGTVQEECSIFEVPNVVLRDYTERTETQEHGNCIISGKKPENIKEAFKIVTKMPSVDCPVEYKYEHVADTVIRILLSNN